MKVKQGPKGVIGQMRSFRDTALSRFVFIVANSCQYSIYLIGVGFLPWAWIKRAIKRETDVMMVSDSQFSETN